jgi:hypothetical protein
MEALSDLSQSALEALVRNYVLIITITILVLALTLYIYFFPTSIAEYFKDPSADKKLPVIGRV